MKLKEAFNRLRFTISSKNKPNDTDVEAFNKLTEYLQKVQNETVQENLLFAKLFTFLLENLVIRYNNVDEAHKQLNKILSEPMQHRIAMLTMQLKNSEVTQVFKDPILEGKNEEQLREIFSRNNKFEQDFLTCWDFWDEDNVTSHLNQSINLSIHNYKDHV